MDIAMTTAPPHPEDRSFSTAYRALRGTLLGFLATQIGDAQAAEDLLHDVMLKVLANEQAGCAAPDNVDGWLYTVARNAAIDWHRARRPSRATADALSRHRAQFGTFREAREPAPAAFGIADGPTTPSGYVGCLRRTTGRPPAAR